MSPDRPPRESFPPLEYATPAPRPDVQPAPMPPVVGAAAALFGASTLICGAVGIVWVARHWRRTDGQDVFEIALFHLIAALCTLVCLRWIRSTTRPGRHTPAADPDL
jgi:hypothetical protein